ncbi:MAG: rod shape-determining protein MreC [Proteobacteria bacterium]|nr:rod shape-determining protein MreC [Pseudomonadota bacterium]
MSFYKKYQSIIIASILIIASIIILSLNLKQFGRVSFLRKLVLEAAAPLEKVVNSTIEGISGIWERHVFLVELEEENRRLRNKIVFLTKEINRYREVSLEGVRLKKLLALKEGIDYPTVAARVIGRNRSSVFKMILINRGTTDGVKVGSPVLTDKGIIGRIIETSWNVSRVLLLVDYNSNVDALIQGNRARGVLQGRGSKGCSLRYVQRSEEVKVGDTVISSGLARVFPKGLLLGTVKKVEKKKFGLFQEIEVAPAVDFSRLEEVLVILTDVIDQPQRH